MGHKEQQEVACFANETVRFLPAQKDGGGAVKIRTKSSAELFKVHHVVPEEQKFVDRFSHGPRKGPSSDRVPGRL